MTWLVWKEYRQNRLAVFVTLLALIVPYLAWPVMTFVSWWRQWPSDHGEPFWLLWLGTASYFSIMLGQPAMALIGANVIAGERVDRSEQFQAALPITRNRILVAKLVLALLIVAVIWLPNVPILGGVVLAVSPRTVDIPHDTVFLVNVAITGLTFFCVAWFFSSLLGSPAIGACAGLITPFLAWTLPMIVMWARGFEYYTGQHVLAGYFSMYRGYIPLVLAILEFWAHTICLATSAIGLTLGTWIYLRRRELAS
jgi:ABC-type transport system involved in multi-copper enzyme maturation permease subunit